jgi:hypothetical protein
LGWPGAIHGARSKEHTSSEPESCQEFVKRPPASILATGVLSLDADQRSAGCGDAKVIQLERQD